MTIINVCNLFAPIVGPLIGIINILILILIVTTTESCFIIIQSHQSNQTLTLFR